MSFEKTWIRSYLIAGSIAASLTIVGCASQSVDDASTTASDLSADDQALGACPNTPPANGSACSSNGLGCSYGDDARFGCRTQAVCNSDTGKKRWEVETAACPEPPPSCPVSEPKSAAKCNGKDLGLTCVYSNHAYTCTPCSGTLCFQENTWSETDVDAACPTAVPNLGSACSTPHLFCNYNVCADDQIPPNQWAYGIGERCEQGQWQFYGGKQACL
jgi:hypothetical protein